MFGGDFSSSWGSPLVLSKLDSRPLVLSKARLESSSLVRLYPCLVSVELTTDEENVGILDGEASSALFVAILETQDVFCLKKAIN